MAYYEGQVSDLGNCNNNGGVFGGDWWGGIIGLIAVAAIFGGGFGNGGLFGGNRGGGVGAEVQRGFDTSAIINKLDGINNGLCDGFYAMNTSLLTGFGNTNTAIMQNGYETRSAITDLGYRQQDCCCQTQRAIDGVNYNLAKSTCDITNTIQNTTRDIIDSQRDGTAAILNFLTQDKIATLTAENQSLKFAASQSAQNAFIAANSDAQTAELIRRFGLDRATCPIPAYVVPNPNCCYGNPYGVGYSGSCACGASVQ